MEDKDGFLPSEYYKEAGSRGKGGGCTRVREIMSHVVCRQVALVRRQAWFSLEMVFRIWCYSTVFN